MIAHDAVAYEEALEIQKQSKIVLTSNQKSKYGLHERILSAMACGALAVTTRCPYVEQCFQDGEEIVLFDHQNYEFLKKQLRDYLGNESTRKEIAERGREAVMSSHTWDHRVETILSQQENFVIPE